MKTMTKTGYEPKRLEEIYNGLQAEYTSPKALFIQRMADACLCAQQTVKCWICGTQRPSTLTQEVMISAMIKYGYIKSREQLDIDNFFPYRKR